MTTELSPTIYMRKAESALDSARLLLEADHADDACNRAYYAMFDAAHAALFALGVDEIKAPINTHNGLVAKFGKHLVLGNHLATEHGEEFNAVQRLRQIADYSGDHVSRTDAAWAVAPRKPCLQRSRRNLRCDRRHRSYAPRAARGDPAVRQGRRNAALDCPQIRRQRGHDFEVVAVTIKIANLPPSRSSGVTALVGRLCQLE